jgi:hypothetical protein
MISRYWGDNNLLQAVQNTLKLSVPVHVGSTNVKLLCWVVILLPEINKQKLVLTKGLRSKRRVSVQNIYHLWQALKKQPAFILYEFIKLLNVIKCCSKYFYGTNFSEIKL